MHSAPLLMASVIQLVYWNRESVVSALTENSLALTHRASVRACHEMFGPGRGAREMRAETAQAIKRLRTAAQISFRRNRFAQSCR